MKYFIQKNGAVLCGNSVVPVQVDNTDYIALQKDVAAGKSEIVEWMNGFKMRPNADDQTQIELLKALWKVRGELSLPARETFDHYFL